MLPMMNDEDMIALYVAAGFAAPPNEHVQDDEEGGQR